MRPVFPLFVGYFVKSLHVHVKLENIKQIQLSISRNLKKNLFIIYKVVNYKKMLMKYSVYNFIFSLHQSVHITFLDYL